MLNFNLADGKMNGFEIAFLQSEEYADEIIKRFKTSYTGRENPNMLLDAIVEDMNLGNEDLMFDSIRRIENEVGNYVEAF